MGNKKKGDTCTQEIARCGCTKLIWNLGMQEFVLFVSDDVLGLNSFFRMRQWAYSAFLDPWCAGICPVCFG
jgi:hypothetical protein